MNMHPTINKIIAVIAGVAIGVMLMNAIQTFSPFQPPPGVDYTSGDPPYLQWVRALPDKAWMIVLGSMLAGSLLGGFVTNKITPPANFPPLITGFVILFFGIVRYLAFASPAWMTYAACIGCLAFAWAGGWLSPRVRLKNTFGFENK